MRAVIEILHLSVGFIRCLMAFQLVVILSVIMEIIPGIKIIVAGTVTRRVTVIWMISMFFILF